MKKIVCIVGLCGAGKSVVADYFTEKGYQFVRFGQIVLDEVKKKKLEPNEKNERKIRENIRKKHGMGAMAILNIPKFKILIKNGNVVGDGLYSFDEYKILKKEFGDKLIIVAVFAPPKLRYERISKRVMPKSDTDLRNRPFSKKEAKNRDFAEIENLDKGGPIAMADYTIVNTKSLVHLKREVEKIYLKIEKTF
ncbi:MAG: AAA family ATPase [Patescibacteria group bacterium]